ncbi:MAG: adenylyltransferase/cytidyltransferase family protein [Acidobacteriia bacterium]|nr:adenylyltransferase/cytidyltransferase family protein [Terriglobia bacterium]
MSAATKVLPLPRLVEALAPLRAAGRTVALANGLFDLLHVGHLRYLEGAKAEADVLVVGVNSDASARRLKGPSRPIVPEDERAELVAGLECVDFVTLFPEPTVETLMRALRPAVHCKGTDYAVGTVPEREIAGELGIRIAIVGDPKRHATRDLLRAIRDPAPETSEEGSS